jgi:VCBS repeat-containing protein
MLASATITLTNAKAADFLSVGSLPPGIGASINTSVAGQITVALSGVASKANYESAIEAIRFSNTSDNPDTTPRQITVTVSDSLASSATATSTININIVNTPPELIGDLSATVAEGGSYTLSIADLNYIDGDDLPDDVTFTASNLTAGRIEVNGSTATSFTGTQLQASQVRFVHDGSETTTASFAVRVEDGNEDGSTPIPAIFNLTVTPVNDAPTVSSQSFDVAEREVISAPAISGLLVGVNDPETDPVTITSVSFKKLATVLDTSFNESVLDSLIHLDVPNNAKGDIIFDPRNGELDFTARDNTDMWGSRADAPIAWVETPDVVSGGKWSFETQVRIDQRQEGTVVSGITFFNNDGGLPDFTFGINNWNGGFVHVQQLAGGRKQFNDLGDLNSSSTPTNPDGSTSAFLKVEVVEQGTQDAYQFFYKLNAADSWSALNTTPVSTYSYDRIGLFQKTGGAKSGTSFSELKVQSEVVETVSIPAGGRADIETEYGTLTVASDGSYTFVANGASAIALDESEVANLQFTYTAQDQPSVGQVADALGQFSIAITGVAGGSGSVITVIENQLQSYLTDNPEYTFNDADIVTLEVENSPQGKKLDLSLKDLQKLNIDAVALIGNATGEQANDLSIDLGTGANLGSDAIPSFSEGDDITLNHICGCCS